MVKIFNGTMHEVTLYGEGSAYPIQGGRKLILNEGALPVMVIEAGTSNLNCKKGNRPAPELRVEGVTLKGAIEFISYDPLPEGYDLYIVSNLYRSAVKELGGDTSKLCTIDGAVYADETATRPVGCLALAVG